MTAITTYYKTNLRQFKEAYNFTHVHVKKYTFIF